MPEDRCQNGGACLMTTSKGEHIVLGAKQLLFGPVHLTAVRHTTGPAAEKYTARGSKVQPTALIIDDDTDLLTLMELGLGREGFRVVTASSGEEGLRLAYEARPDIIILDIMMPEMDGWRVCERLRQVCDIPIVMLTVKNGQKDIIRGLALGADDYLTKPCDFDELTARIHTILRRSSAASTDRWRSLFDDGNLCIDLREGTVRRRGEPIDLSPTESRLLMCLASHQGRTVPQKDLLTAVWGPECANEAGYLSVYIRYLRRKIEDDPANPRYIRTRWGVGYYFDGDGFVRLEGGREEPAGTEVEPTEGYRRHEASA
jgi:DNA-binding response OmpR family regulator